MTYHGRSGLERFSKINQFIGKLGKQLSTGKIKYLVKQTIKLERQELGVKWHILPALRILTFRAINET